MRREKFYLFTYLLLLPLVAASQTDLAELNTDFDSPVLTSLTVDKPSVDVSESEQTVTFTVGFTDESGIEGTSGANWITLQSANTGAYKFAYLNQTQSPITSSPITTTATFNSSDASGNWEITQVYMRDPVGNAKWYYRSDLDALGVPASIEVVGGETDFDSPVLTSLTVDKPSVDVSESEQTVTFTVGFTDESGIEGTSGANWITLQSANTGAYKFAYLNQTQSPITSSPITTTATFNSSDASGNWEITQVYMRDPVGNAKWYYRSDLDALGVPASIEVVGGETDFDSPVLTSLTVDKPSVDVSESEQTVTFTVGFTDESGIEGTSGANWITLQSANTGAYKFAYLNQTQSPITSSPITTTATFNSSDASGNWEITQVYMRDPVGNAKWYYRSDLDALGVPTYLAVLDGEVSSTDLVLSADALNKTIVQNSSFTYPFTIRNASSETIDELTLKIYTEGAAFSSFTTGFSAWSCSITSINFSSQLQCALSSIAAGESKSSTLTLYTGTDVNGLIRLEVYTDKPDSSYADNKLDIEFSIEPDGDDDDVSDGSDNCLSVANPDQTDTDSDGQGNACDTDDDGDGTIDTDDVFPLDATETIDTDGDGFGNNADTDDDNDGTLDVNDPYPLVVPSTLTFNYAGNTDKPIAGISIIHSESNGTVTTLTSDASGQVTLPATTSNPYTLLASFTVSGEDPISLLDAMWILQHGGELRTLTTDQLKAADVNEDGEVGVLDAIWIVQHLGELRTISPNLVFLDVSSGLELSEVTFNPTDALSVSIFHRGDVNQDFNPATISSASLNTKDILIESEFNELANDTKDYNLNDKDLNVNLFPGSLTNKISVTHNNTTASKLDTNNTMESLEDYDGDGLPDAYELANDNDPYDRNDITKDADGDGLTIQEEFIHGTSDQNPDTDFDTLPDGWEVAQGRNPLLADYQISTGAESSCALADNGVVCWGKNNGSLDVPNLYNPTAIAVGNTFACALENLEEICWGNNQESLIGKPSLTEGICSIEDSGIVCQNDVTFGSPPLIENAAQVSAGISSACALAPDGVTCWGYNLNGENDVPALVIDPDGDGYSNQNGVDAFPLDPTRW